MTPLKEATRSGIAPQANTCLDNRVASFTFDLVWLVIREELWVRLWLGTRDHIRQEIKETLP